MSLNIGQIPYSDGSTLVNVGTVVPADTKSELNITLVSANAPNPPSDRAQIFLSDANGWPWYILTPDSPFFHETLNPADLWVLVLGETDLVQVFARQV